jgi:hypothetical protein
VRRCYAEGGITEAQCRQSMNFSRGPRICDDNIDVDLKQIECEFLYCIRLDQDRVHLTVLVNTVMKFWVP